MAIVTDWAKPLEDALLKQLESSATNHEALEKIRRTAALLDGAPLSGTLARRLAEKAEQLERAYQSAADAASRGETSDAVDSAIRALAEFRGYKDADRLIDEARQRADRLRQEEAARALAAKKRKAWITAGIAAAIVAVVAFFIVRGTLYTNRITKRIAEIQLLADAGQDDEAIDAVSALVGEGVTADRFSTLSAVTETVLENTADREGFDAAYARFDALTASIPEAVSPSRFPFFARDRLADDTLDAGERWNLYRLITGHGNFVSLEVRDSVVNGVLATLSADEGWDLVKQALEDGVLSVRDDVPKAAFEAALQAADGQRAWTIASEAVALGLVESDDALVQGAFSRSVADLPVEQTWDVVYAARRDGTASVSHELFAEAYNARVHDMNVVDVFAEYATFIEDETFSEFPDSTRRQVQDSCLKQLIQELAAGSGRDMAAWAQANQAAMDAIPADPDTALAFLYALNDAGQDVAALFPDGLLVDVPMATRVCTLMNRLVNGESVAMAPTLQTLLPVSVRENGARYYALSTPIRFTLDSEVEKVRSNDANYQVRLLTEYLFQIPESMRPATFSECGALLCMQQTYVMTGSIEHTGGNIAGISVNTTSYLPVLGAVDMVAVYDLADPSQGMRISARVQDAQASDDAWFEHNKTNDTVILPTNRMGSFDSETLRQDYRSAMENPGLLSLYVLISNNPTEEADHDAD